MKECDLCSLGVNDTALKCVSAEQFRKAIDNGLMPGSEMIEAAKKLGEKETFIADWYMRAQREISDWGLCTKCYDRVMAKLAPAGSRFNADDLAALDSLKNKKPWQFWK